MRIPADLERQRALGPDWGAWLDRLPRLVDELLDEWDLAVDGEPMCGFCSVVVPVRTAAGEPAVLKVGFDGDDEGEFEGLMLQRAGGRGMVRLLRADPGRHALLLERVHARDLSSVGDTEACEIVAGLYPVIHRPAPPQLRTVTSYVARWAAALGTLPRDAPVPRRLVEQAVSLARDLVADPASVGTTVHGDLHQHNVLAADREPWLVIDPKPMSGDPHYEPAPMLWNLWDRVTESGNVRGAVRRRFFTLVDDGGLDEQRARDWVVVRMVLNAHWSIQDAQRAARALDEGEREWITRCIAIAKAVQD
ncbi:aminoglycoside phosphotransferase family protein [Nocardioides sp. LS1]|uniref:aminoglycoside phosphotransferase family protein n=1 Tax=Nocardioides sp. LS1 TaxID=1027620 RepID=UPI000F62320B|nr:aminoglycoside phosphotransferase family protein [Nocardioides sp. LS1]GCD88419.1 streptomycin 6-kinase [Nocardioides sp. LS1]